MYSLPQKLVAEFIGTFTLIFIGAGSICADQYLARRRPERSRAAGHRRWRTGWRSASWSPPWATFPAAI